jgi:hypothetical protein
MGRIRWDRVLATIILLILPLLWHWLSSNVALGSLCEVPILGTLALNPKTKGLLLLGVVLLTVLAVCKVVAKGGGNER